MGTQQLELDNTYPFIKVKRISGLVQMYSTVICIFELKSLPLNLALFQGFDSRIQDLGYRLA